MVTSVKQQAWTVFAPLPNGKYKEQVAIDVVFFSEGIEADSVRKSLIEHDGYDPNIRVKKKNGFSTTQKA